MRLQAFWHTALTKNGSKHVKHRNFSVSSTVAQPMRCAQIRLNPHPTNPRAPIPCQERDSMAHLLVERCNVLITCEETAALRILSTSDAQMPSLPLYRYRDESCEAKLDAHSKDPVACAPLVASLQQDSAFCTCEFRFALSSLPLAGCPRSCRNHGRRISMCTARSSGTR